MIAKNRILIVDTSRESREILNTLLTHKGSEVLESSKINEATEIAARERLDLIVCDADADRSASFQAATRLTVAASRNAIPIVVLGTIRRDFGPTSAADVIRKPYHYEPLVRKIEALLGTKS